MPGFSEECDLENSRYVKEMLDRIQQRAEKLSFGERLMFFPYWKDVGKPIQSSLGERGQTVLLEQTIRNKLDKYRRVQVSIIAYTIVLIIYLLAISMAVMADGFKVFSWISATLISIICSTVFLVIVLASERLWTDRWINITMYCSKLIVHTLFIIALFRNAALPSFVKISMIRSGSLISVMTDSRFIGASLLVLLSDVNIMLITGAKDDIVDRTAFQTWICVGCYTLSASYYLFFFFWNQASFDDLAGLLGMALEKLLLHLKTYKTLGGEPTFWQNSSAETFKCKENNLTDLYLSKRTSCPGVVNPNSVAGFNQRDRTGIEKTAFSDSYSPTSDDFRVAVSANQIEDILKNVHYTEYTILKGYTDDSADPEQNLTDFTNACSSFSLAMSNELRQSESLDMTYVWQELVNLILSRFDCIIDIVNLEFRTDDSPAPSVKCRLRVFSAWSASEKTRLYYSKLQRDDLKKPESRRLASKSGSPKSKFLSPLPIVEENFEREDIHGTPSTFPKKSPIMSNLTSINRIEIQKVPFLAVSPQTINYMVSPSLVRQSPYNPEELISIVVHDMRSPLMCVLGNLELLDFEMKDKSGYNLIKPLIQSSMASCALLENLVSDILDAARISKGIFKINPSKFNLEEAIRECLSTIQIAANSKQIKLHLDYEANHKLILSDKHRMKQVIINFMSNSVKFTNHGDIWIKVEENVNTMQISIKDNGSGISPDLMPHIFQKFRSDRKSGNNTKGIGLGLFICKSIISNIGPKKDIKVESKLGKGTVFTFEIYKDVEIKEDSKTFLASTTLPNERNFIAGSYGLRTAKSGSFKEIEKINKGEGSGDRMSIFALNDQSSLASRRLIQTKMKWDISWITKHVRDSDNPPLVRRKSDTTGSGPFAEQEALKVIEPNSLADTPIHTSSTHMTFSSEASLQRPQLLNKATMDVNEIEDDRSFKNPISPLRVLIVDDEPLILELIRDFFKAAGADLKIEVEEDSACSIEEAHEKISKHSYDLVMVDFYLQDGTGPEFVKQYLLAHDKSDKLPLFALSTGAEMSEIENEVDINLFFSILLKPITLSKFKELLQKVSEARQA